MKEIACDVLFEKGHTIAEKIFEGPIRMRCFQRLVSLF